MKGLVSRITGLFSRSKKSNSFSRANRRRFLVESLEDRSLMAAVAGDIDFTKLPLSSVSPITTGNTATPAAVNVATSTNQAAVLVDDSYEQNDTRATARNLGTISGPRTISSLVMADSNDWYKFTLSSRPAAGSTVSISFENAQGNLNLALFNASGTRVRYSGTTNDTEQVSLYGLAAGTYYIRVYGNLAAHNPSYSLSIKPAQATVADDAYEQNDTFGTARDLGTLTSARTVSNLVMADTHDWYRFTMSGSGTSSDFVGVSSGSVQGDLDLELYNPGGARVGLSQSPTNSERISLAGRASGTYYVHVIGYGGARTPSYSLQIAPGTSTTTTSPATGAFNIQFTFSGLTTSQQGIFQQAAAKWQSIIVGDLPSATYGGRSVDDLLIAARGAAIDGTGNILGQAGPDAFRGSLGLPYHGTMEFDTADLASMQANGTLLGVIEHEMGHVLGIGTIWTDKGLLVGAGTSNPIFVGAQATAAYNSIYGTSVRGVPVENSGGSGTRDSHWRESILGNELMTGWVGPGSNMPISRITVGSLADIGYTVNFATADPFSRTSALSAALVSTDATTSTTSNSARLADSSTPILLPIAERLRDSLFASWGAAPRHDELQSAFTVASQQSHEAATDALLTHWSSLTSDLRA